MYSQFFLWLRYEKGVSIKMKHVILKYNIFILFLVFLNLLFFKSNKISFTDFKIIKITEHDGIAWKWVASYVTQELILLGKLEKS